MNDAPRNSLAPELRVSRWIDAEGRPTAALKLADLGEGFKVIYCFQHWCPGCHSHGFPTLKTPVESLSSHGFGFAAVQTVFEGSNVNTFERLRENQARYGLKIPFGHVMPEGGRYPRLMSDYRTSGTPWFIVLDPMGEVLRSDFQLDAQSLIRAFGRDEALPRAA